MQTQNYRVLDTIERESERERERERVREREREKEREIRRGKKDMKRVYDRIDSLEFHCNSSGETIQTNTTRHQRREEGQYQHKDVSLLGQDRTGLFCSLSC
jgi:hypothetical protein